MRRLALVLSVLSSQAAAQPVEVDLELALMVDVSRSMSAEELFIQRQGYADALRSDEVFAAVQTGLLQNIALSYVEWAGTQTVVVDWTLVQSRADLDAFARAVERSMSGGMRRTSISEALVFGAGMIEDNGFAGMRRVIDISGDGPNNEGRLVTRARDDVVSRRITVNGLPLMTQEGDDRWYLEDLDVYYQSCVIGGPGAFVVPVLDWTDFAEAVRRKLVLEIAARPQDDREPETLHRAQYTQAAPYDCEIGEKIWAQRRAIWGEP